MATIHMDINIQTIHDNKYYATRAAVWTEDNKQRRSVYYSFGPTVSAAEVWENCTCISSDPIFAMAYLRGAGFKGEPTFEQFADYNVLVDEINEQFEVDRVPDEAEPEAPF